MTPLAALRIGLPVAMAFLGILLIVTGGDAADGAGVVIIGSAVLVFLLNALLRSSLKEEGDRAREQDARDFYARHGRWPEDPDPAAAPPPEPEPPAAPRPSHPGAIEVTPPGGDRGGRTRRRPPRRPPRRPRPGP
jgi:hypothetical protein